jgi:protease-4
MGIRLRFIKSGEHKDMFGFHRDLTKEEEKMTQKLSDEIYDTFISRIAENRKIPIEKVRKIADGEVFSGKKAKEIGLIDENGDLTDAINIASKLCKVPKNRIVHLSPRKPLLQRLLSPIISEFFNSIFDILDETYMF